MLLLNTVKIVLIALNILPNRMKHKKIMFFIYMGTLVTHGKEKLFGSFIPSSPINHEAINYREKRNSEEKKKKVGKTLKVFLMKKCLWESFFLFSVIVKSITDISNKASDRNEFFPANERIGKWKVEEKCNESSKQMSNFNDGKMWNFFFIANAKLVD